MRVSARRHDKATIFDLSGDIDFANSPEVRQSVLREIRESRTPRVLVNLSQVRYIDSSGVATLVEGLKASRDLGSRFSLFGLSPPGRFCSSPASSKSLKFTTTKNRQWLPWSAQCAQSESHRITKSDARGKTRLKR